MIVLIVNTGRVEQRVVDTGRVLVDADGEALVAAIRSRLNEVAAGVPFTVAATRLRRLVQDAEGLDETDRGPMEAVVSALEGILTGALLQPEGRREAYVQDTVSTILEGLVAPDAQ